MKFNQLMSDFTYLGDYIKEFQITNSHIKIEDDTEKTWGLDVEVGTIESTESTFQGTVLLKTEVTISSDASTPSIISLLIEGCFSAPISVGKDEFEKLLLVNGAACLYSIARSKIEAMTALSFYSGSIKLPLINILDFYKDRLTEQMPLTDEN
ncbi:MAG: hypothetical protein R3Y06_05405 [Faecalibacterium sp.]